MEKYEQVLLDSSTDMFAFTLKSTDNQGLVR
jgi:hypothetical protein